MNLSERVKNICLTPQSEWPVIAEEHTPTAGLITGYVVPLASLGAVAGLIGGSVIGRTLPFVGTYRTPLTTGLGVAVLAVVMAVIGCFVISAIINALAPTFGAEKNSAQALKVAVYSYTPAWVAGVFQVLPVLGVLSLLGALYGLYLLFLGLPKLMKCPPEKAVGYTAVVVVSAVVVFVVIGAIGTAVIGVGAVTAGRVSGGTSSGTASGAEVDADSPLGRLEEIGRALEESGRRAEAAAEAGDQEGQVAAALEGLGALLGGGERVDPLDIDVLRPFLPEAFAGLPRTSRNVEKTGLGTIMVTRAEAVYDDGGDRSVTLEITDTGGVSGLMGLAGWMGVEQESESDDGYERTRQVDGRLIHEKSSRGDDEFAVVVAGRFLVSATGRGVDVDALRAGVSSLDLDRLESME